MSMAPPLWHSIAYSTTPSSLEPWPASRERRKSRGRPSRSAARDSARTAVWAQLPPTQPMTTRSGRSIVQAIAVRNRIGIRDEGLQRLARGQRASRSLCLGRRVDVHKDAGIVDRDFEDLSPVVREDRAKSLVPGDGRHLAGERTIHEDGIPADTPERGNHDLR